MSLFKDNLMWKPDKPSLRKVILKDEESIASNLPDVQTIVIDGGGLLHRVRWNKGMKFKDIAASYVNYAKKHYGTASIVFDGYKGPTTKDSEHARREKYTSHSVRINEVKSNQDRFLSNRDNKVQIISLIAVWLYMNGNEVFVCKGDADCKIVSVTLSIAKEKPVIVVADDTDIAILLRKHWMDHM